MPIPASSNIRPVASQPDLPGPARAISRGMIIRINSLALSIIAHNCLLDVLQSNMRLHSWMWFEADNVKLCSVDTPTAQRAAFKQQQASHTCGELIYRIALITSTFMNECKMHALYKLFAKYVWFIRKVPYCGIHKGDLLRKL